MRFGLFGSAQARRGCEIDVQVVAVSAIAANGAVKSAH